MTQEQARERVARGAGFLDEKRPGWEMCIDVGTLTLHDSCGCIVGQLCNTFSAFQRGLRILGVEDPVVLGMERPEVKTAPFEDMIAESKAMYALLQNAWIEAIADRLLPVAVEREQVAVTKGGA